MANCKEYQDLLPKEKAEFIGMLVHCVQSDSELFETGQRLIKKAIKKKLFEGIVIHPPDWNNVPPDDVVPEPY